MSELEKWSVKREISLGTLITIVIQSAALVWFVAGIDNRVTTLRSSYLDFVQAANVRFTNTEQSIVTLTTQLNSEIRAMQASSSEVNGRLVRIETLLTQIIENQDRGSNSP